MGDPIINTQVDAINSTLGNIKVDLAALRPSIRAIKDAIAETYLTDTIENVPIASFSDGADEIPVRELQVAINPIQSLNGQTSPYPAGGGKNKVPVGANKESSGITYTVNADGTVKATGTATATTFWGVQFTIPAGSYILNGCPSGGSASSYYMDIRNAVGGAGIAGISADTGNGSSFTLTEALTAYVNIRTANGYAYPTGGLVFKPMIRLATDTDPTFAPYSNICPISGHTEVKVYKTGKNLLEWYQPASVTHNGVTFTYNDDGTVTANGTATADAYIELTSYKAYSGLFTYTGNPTGSSASTYRTQYRWRNNGTFGSWGYANDSYQNLSEVANADAFRIRLVVKSGQTVNNLVFKPMLRLTSDTDDTYEPFAGARYVFSLGQTVYGGTLNVTTGVLTIDRKEFDLGSLGWAKSSIVTNGFVATSGLPDWFLRAADNLKVIPAISDTYTATSYSNWLNGLNGKMSYRDAASGKGIAINDASLASYYQSFDPAAFALAVAGKKIVYTLATPTTVQLTAAEVETLFGQNNVWADANGNVVKLTYRKAWEIALAQGE